MSKYTLKDIWDFPEEFINKNLGNRWKDGLDAKRSEAAVELVKLQRLDYDDLTLLGNIRKEGPLRFLLPVLMRSPCEMKPLVNPRNTKYSTKIPCDINTGNLKLDDCVKLKIYEMIDIMVTWLNDLRNLQHEQFTRQMLEPDDDYEDIFVEGNHNFFESSYLREVLDKKYEELNIPEGGFLVNRIGFITKTILDRFFADVADTTEPGTLITIEVLYKFFHDDCENDYDFLDLSFDPLRVKVGDSPNFNVTFQEYKSALLTYGYSGIMDMYTKYRQYDVLLLDQFGVKTFENFREFFDINQEARDLECCKDNEHYTGKTQDFKFKLYCIRNIPGVHFKNIDMVKSLINL
jgi:hypothetical protein